MKYKTPESNLTYMVVQNTEEHYSIWAAVRQIPIGWETASKTGSLDDCLSYISERCAVLPLSECKPTQCFD